MRIPSYKKCDNPKCKTTDKKLSIEWTSLSVNDYKVGDCISGAYDFCSYECLVDTIKTDSIKKIKENSVIRKK